jgi:hypothetical protein
VLLACRRILPDFASQNAGGPMVGLQVRMEEFAPEVTSGSSLMKPAIHSALGFNNFRTYSEASADPMGFFRFSQPGAFVQDSSY